MASSNIKLFDENKGNMLSDSEFSISNQRMNGLQTGVASSQLQNKAMYQASLVAYAIAQVMMQNGKNANDTDAVSAFVANLSGTMLQKVYDVATTAEAQVGTATGKWMSPALVKAAIDTLAAKAQNILSDETKALYGLGADAVPDDAMAILSRLHKGLGNEYIWSKNEVSYSPKFNATYTSAPIISGNSATSGSLTFYNSLEYVDGKYQLKDVYETFNFTISTIHNVITADVLNVGEKYFADSSGRIYKTLPGSSYGTYGGANPNFTATMENCFLYTGVATNLNFVDYVNSHDPNAYPPSEPDGYTYMLLGQLANLGVKIATGNYSGTGVGGSSSPNTLTFDFEPQILLIATKDRSGVKYFVASRNSEYSFLVSLYDGSPAKCSYSSIITWSGKTVSWYCTADRSYQMNYEGLTYNYIAIG